MINFTWLCSGRKGPFGMGVNGTLGFDRCCPGKLDELRLFLFYGAGFVKGFAKFLMRLNSLTELGLQPSLIAGVSSHNKPSSDVFPPITTISFVIPGKSKNNTTFSNLSTKMAE